MSKFMGLFFVTMAGVSIAAAAVGAAVRLAAPTELVAVTSQSVEGAVELKWRAVKGATTYTIAASRENDSNWQDVGSTSETVFQVNELPEGTKYFFRVAASSKFGQGDWSSAVSQLASGKQHLHLGRGLVPRRSPIFVQAGCR